jgi:hypothetical protein
MSVGRFLVLASVVLLGLGTGISTASAQSLFAGRGLGYAMEPLDARSRGLGGVGLGLPEPSLTLINPASVAGLPAATLHVTVQPDQFTSTFNGAEVSATTVRFPLIHAALPFRRWTATIGYSSFRDRNWAVERDTTLQVGGATVGVRDRFASHGGVARLRIGTAYALDERFALGASVDVYSGSAQDTIYRIFDEIGINPAVEASSVRFRGLGYGMGGRWVPSPAFALEASVSAGGELQLRPDAEAATERRFDLPIMAAAGVSGRLTPTTLVAIAGRWNGWSSVDGALAADGGARDTWSVMGGIEWDAVRFGEYVVPLRLGARHALLPFRWNDAGGANGWPDERAASLGAGLRLAGGAATLDGSVERGRRGGDAVGITESFWRMAFSLTVLGR